MKPSQLLAEFSSQVWAIKADALQRMVGTLHRLAIQDLDIEVSDTMLEKFAETRAPRSGGEGVAIVPVYGSISHRSSIWEAFFGGTSCQRIEANLQSLMANPQISRIVLDVDSPGGTVDGVLELADYIRECREQKSITAVANSMAASAAYWLATQASELCVAPSGEVGSVGVFMMHADQSELMKQFGIKVTFIKAGDYKTEGNPFEPLSDEAQAYMQTQVDHYYDLFLKAVAQGRGVTRSKVISTFGQGRMVTAKEAVERGMADRIMTLGTAIGKRATLMATSTEQRPAAEAGERETEASVAKRQGADPENERDDYEDKDKKDGKAEEEKQDDENDTKPDKDGKKGRRADDGDGDEDDKDKEKKSEKDDDGDEDDKDKKKGRRASDEDDEDEGKKADWELFRLRNS